MRIYAMEAQKSDSERQKVSILMLGLDDAGKTTILYKLKLDDGSDIKTIPTIGYNVETVEFEGKSYTFWDIGGRDTVRVLWKFYAENKAVVVFVVDASNPERFGEAKDFLHTIMSYEVLNDVVLFIISNKHDKANCVTNGEMMEKLNLNMLKQQICIINTSSFDRESLADIMFHLKNISLR